MKWLVHDNLNRFLGICFPVKNSNVFYHIAEYCPKGSLHSVLAKEEMMLDLSFKLSFIFDIAKVGHDHAILKGILREVKAK